MAKTDPIQLRAITHKNLSIQCLRGLAALSVALFHASVHSGLHFGDSGWATAFDGRFGLIGVSIFFAISGLLMAGIPRTEPWRFLPPPHARIYPPSFFSRFSTTPLRRIRA